MNRVIFLAAVRDCSRDRTFSVRFLSMEFTTFYFSNSSGIARRSCGHFTDVIHIQALSRPLLIIGHSVPQKIFHLCATFLS
jgi:hypothetical protein